MDGAQRLGGPGSLGQSPSGPCFGEIAQEARRNGAYSFGTVPKYSDAGARSRIPALGKGDVENCGGDRQLDSALQLIDEQIAQIERPGWDERLYYAEVLRLKGWMLSLKGDFEGAERNFLASLEWARRQLAKSWELRTSISLARLWQSQGKRQEAYGLLAPVYDWFTEGFDTKDLQEAKALLHELA